MLVKVGQGQVLEPLKELPAQAVDAPLGQADHGGHLDIGRRRPQEIDAQELDQGEPQPQHVAGPGVDKVVDDGPEHIGPGQVGAHRNQQAQKDQRQQRRPARHVGEQPQRGLSGVLGFLVAPAHTGAVAPGA